MPPLRPPCLVPVEDAPPAASDPSTEILQPAIPVGGGSWTDMMYEETDVDGISLSDLGSTKTKVTKPKRAGNYTHEEDIQLCMAWDNISTDPITANEQPGRAYWKRIAEHYHKHKTFEFDRNANSLEHRWSTIQKDCMLFQAFYEEVERLHPSGVPFQEHILQAQTLYAKPPQKKTFHFLHCWLKIRHCQKFLSIETNKRPWGNSRSSTPSEGTAEEGDASGRCQTPDSTQPMPKKRPIGRKKAKEILKKGGDAGPYKEAIEELLLEKEEKKFRAERWAEEKRMKEDRWRETKMIHEKKVSLEEKRLMWEREQKIMFCDLNTLDESQKTYVLAMRAQIAAEKMAAFNGVFGNDFGASSGGSGGDGGGDGDGTTQ